MIYNIHTEGVVVLVYDSHDVLLISDSYQWGSVAILVTWLVIPSH